jgi:hypothetical protein
MKTSLAALLANTLVLAGTVQAHHSFAMFDTTNRVTLVGTVSTFEWTNPHVIIGIDVPDQGGAPKTWTIELGSPSILMRVGWKFNDLKPGDKLTVVVNPLKSGQRGGLLVSATLADGRVLGLGGGQSTPPSPSPAGATGR